MQGGGHISGWSVSGGKAEELEAVLNALTFSEGGGAALAVADGNHSLATAKLCWERAKAGLTDEQRKTHRARYALAELVNIYDSSIRIEPIHRVIAGTDVSGFASFVEERLLRAEKEGKSVRIKAGSADGEREVSVSGLSAGQIIDAADKMIAEYLAEYSGSVDYIHDDESAVEMGSRPGCAYLMLPAVEKEEIFEMVKRKELFPKKSFSIGSAREKRYYLECRRIK